ncbi:MAG: hypothetical protein HC897_08740 [Thermoanaerobaculia bacterium]|nr:hypothetical protein [Thermoanaerobaculia bacterium]
MRRLILLLTLAALLAGILACDSANPVAPAGTVLTVTANPTQIGLSGSSTITVSGFRPDGNPLNPGTQLNVTTSLGVISPSTLVSVAENGRAQVTLAGDGRQGTATVTAATTGGDVTATVDVRIGTDPDSKPKVSVSASPATIGLGEDSRITVFVRGPDDAPLGAGLVVELRTTLGTIKNQTTTNAQGEATATLTAGSVPGTATVTARYASSDEAMTTVMIEERAPQLEIFANPDLIPVLGESEITIRARDSFGVPVGAGEQITLVANLGTVPETVATNANGVARATFSAGDQAGTGSVTAFFRNSQSVSANITIRDAVASIQLSANPTSVDRTDEGVTISLLARVRNAQSDPVGGIVVTFNSPFGTFPSATNGTVVTSAQGEARETLTVTRQQLQTVPLNGTFIITANVSSEGETFTAMVPITVNGNP